MTSFIFAILSQAPTLFVQQWAFTSTLARDNNPSTRTWTNFLSKDNMRQKNKHGLRGSEAYCVRRNYIFNDIFHNFQACTWAREGVCTLRLRLLQLLKLTAASPDARPSFAAGDGKTSDTPGQNMEHESETFFSPFKQGNFTLALNLISD